MYKHRKITAVRKFVLLAAGIVALGLWQVKNLIYQPVYLDNPAYVVVSRGSGTAVTAQRLKEAGVIDKPWLFRLAARFWGLDRHLKAGEYVFTGTVSVYDVIHKIGRGEVSYRRLTLAEGLTSKQMLEAIADEPLLDGQITISPAEGSLLPETYNFMRGDSRDSVIAQAQKAMSEALESAWNNRQDDLPLKNKQELLILASIIEKETAVGSERRLVASVFVNRLRKGMKLQTDPTVIYALTNGQKDLERPLLRKDLAIDSPFNTYKYYGLPPAPICNPGKASLEAAANPETSDYLYFVANGNGGHNFAASLKEHNNNVRNWKKIRK